MKILLDNVLLISIHCNAVLTEEGQQSLVDLHVDGICAYLCNS